MTNNVKKEEYNGFEDLLVHVTFNYHRKHMEIFKDIFSCLRQSFLI